MKIKSVTDCLISIILQPIWKTCRLLGTVIKWLWREEDGIATISVSATVFSPRCLNAEGAEAWSKRGERRGFHVKDLAGARANELER